MDTDDRGRDGRSVVDADRVREFMSALAAEADTEARVYLTGGASAVLIGWRVTTVEVDLRIVPETDRLFRAIPQLRKTLRIKVVLASPADFIPQLPSWPERSPLISREGLLSFHHYDFYAQALAKLERRHRQDVTDVQEMIARGLVERRQLLEFFEDIEPRLYHYPAIDPPSFRDDVEKIAKE